jgi:hypothetical protein
MQYGLMFPGHQATERAVTPHIRQSLACLCAATMVPRVHPGETAAGPIDIFHRWCVCYWHRTRAVRCVCQLACHYHRHAGFGGGCCSGQVAQEAAAHHPPAERARLQALQEEQTQIQVARAARSAAAQVPDPPIIFHSRLLCVLTECEIPARGNVCVAQTADFLASGVATAFGWYRRLMRWHLKSTPLKTNYFGFAATWFTHQMKRNPRVRAVSLSWGEFAANSLGLNVRNVGGRVKFSVSLNSVQGSIIMELNSVFLMFARGRKSLFVQFRIWMEVGFIAKLVPLLAWHNSS